MDYSGCLYSGSAARRQTPIRNKIDMAAALECGLDLEEAELANDALTALVDNIGQFKHSDASACLAGGGHRSSESSLPPRTVRPVGARDLQGGGSLR